MNILTVSGNTPEKTERRGIVARKKEKKIDLNNLEPEEMEI